MTREEAIEILKQFKRCLADVVFDEKGSEAWQMAIQALSQEPCPYSTKDGYCQYDDISETIPPLEPCDDAISRDMVKEALRNRTGESISECINAIPPINPQPCEDAVSRKDVINAIDKWITEYKPQHHLIQSIRELPSVTQKSGKWHIAHGMYEDRFWCSCGYIRIMDSRMNEWKYCPVCGGAKMVEPQESEVSK